LQCESAKKLARCYRHIENTFNRSPRFPTPGRWNGTSRCYFGRHSYADRLVAGPLGLEPYGMQFGESVEDGTAFVDYMIATSEAEKEGYTEE
jgi:hypothetical protein